MRDFIKYFLAEKSKIVPIVSGRIIKAAIIKSHPPKTERTFLHSETFFDARGNKIEYKEHQAGRIVEWEKFNYDEKGKLIEILEGRVQRPGSNYKEEDFHFVPKIEKNTEKKEIEEYNVRGQKVVSTYWKDGALKSRRLFNENGICTELSEFALNGAVTNRELYDPNGQLLEARRFRSDGSPLNYTENTYNDQSLLCRSVSVSRTGFITHDSIIKYNDLGLMVEFIEHTDDANNAFADLQEASCGFSHKYSYTVDRLMDTDNLYLCGELIMSYKYTYQFW